jgi:hypothetical protein
VAVDMHFINLHIPTIFRSRLIFRDQLAYIRTDRVMLIGTVQSRRGTNLPFQLLFRPANAGDFSGGLSLSPVGSRNDGIMLYAAVIATRDCVGA